MKKGNITIHDLGFGHGRYGIESKGEYPFLVRVDIQELKDLHSLLSELLEQERKSQHEASYDVGHEDGYDLGVEQERKRILSLPCMEKESEDGEVVYTKFINMEKLRNMGRNALRRELKEAIINKTTYEEDPLSVAIKWLP